MAAAEVRLREGGGIAVSIKRQGDIDPDSERYDPRIQTERFDVWRHSIVRKPGRPREVYQAWFRDEDVPKPVCVVTVDGGRGYLEWVHVDEQYRRRGIATEVLRAVDDDIGIETADGVTEAGVRLVESLWPE